MKLLHTDQHSNGLGEQITLSLYVISGTSGSSHENRPYLDKDVGQYLVYIRKSIHANAFKLVKYY